MTRKSLLFLAGLFSVLTSFAGKLPGSGWADQQVQGDSDTTLQKADTTLQQSTTIAETGKKSIQLAEPVNSVNELNRLNPLAIGYVQNYSNKYGGFTREIRDRGRPYLDLIDIILTQHQLPRELKYLALIESELKVNAYSYAGAVGPWQLMPETARNLGLKVNRYVDERRDYYKSTHAACKYLKTLYDLYGDWLLVIAAYNSGPGGVNSAIRRSGSRDFWRLQRFLPAQSQGHVKRFVAVHFILEGKGSVVTATREEAPNWLQAPPLSAEETAGSSVQPISGRYNSVVIVKYLGMDISQFNRLNPEFDKSIATNGNYSLRLPDEKWELFMARKPEILNESVQMLLSQATVSPEAAQR